MSIMERQFQQLVRLTDDLLDVSRITAATASSCGARRSTCGMVLQSAVETTQPLIDAGGHQLTVGAARRRRCGCDADFTRLAQAFGNLLNNAAKYTDPRRLDHADARWAERARRRRQRHRHRRRHRARADLPRIFDMFVQLAPDARARRAAGSASA